MSETNKLVKDTWNGSPIPTSYNVSNDPFRQLLISERQPNKDMMFQCVHCSATFFELEYMKRHKRENHHPDCMHCKKPFERYSELNSHCFKSLRLLRHHKCPRCKEEVLCHTMLEYHRCQVTQRNLEPKIKREKLCVSKKQVPSEKTPKNTPMIGKSTENNFMIGQVPGQNQEGTSELVQQRNPEQSFSLTSLTSPFEANNISDPPLSFYESHHSAIGNSHQNLGVSSESTSFRQYDIFAQKTTELGPLPSLESWYGNRQTAQPSLNVYDGKNTMIQNTYCHAGISPQFLLAGQGLSLGSVQQASYTHPPDFQSSWDFYNQSHMTTHNMYQNTNTGTSEHSQSSSSFYRPDSIESDNFVDSSIWSSETLKSTSTSVVNQNLQNQSEETYCFQCQKRFQYPYYLKKHNERMHKDYAVQECKHCGVELMNKKERNNHLGKTQYSCSGRKCGRIFLCRGLLRSHYAEKHRRALTKYYVSTEMLPEM